ncbi:uncharacterized protein PGTG_03349 [Puccinia graminis f. sp. tritici CRL 75-36-700-3]|uniref:Uncharacterized protein n=1 Tax=Puccinia graminis f. sp. tritici (strain CRL 75-36-700-3 / race SCCL) TaxID=418459 RepID=E3JZB8_PUCGT|nr:uncharacterized protein PGTG_03349 [Puccinia graminis f. sp. tritici CRL 75-36-700-3]EFP77393.1 hypothetical protein PGTG_03349 [Puccinia graminis f. sp. tritici CRL 75-36-700-3]
MSVLNQKPNNQKSDTINSANAMTQWMDEASPVERRTHSRTRRSSSDISGSSSIATFFEIVNVPSQFVSSTRSKFERTKSNIVVVIEDSYSTAFEFEHSDQIKGYESSADSTTFSTRSSLDNDAEDTYDGIDRLDGLLLPDFFTYTSEERELIRQNQPILRTQLTKTDENNSSQPDGTLKQNLQTSNQAIF